MLFPTSIASTEVGLHNTDFCGGDRCRKTAFELLEVASVRRTNCGLWVKVNGKASSLDIAPLTILDSGALQPRKWHLSGNALTVVPQRMLVAAHSPC